MSKGQIVRVDPAAAIPGGEVSVECEEFDTSNMRNCRATVGGEAARMVGTAPWRVMAGAAVQSAKSLQNLVDGNRRLEALRRPQRWA